MRTPKRRIDLTKGMVSNASPHSVPVVSQDNATNTVAGEIKVRPGMAPATFESAQGAATTYQVLHAHTYLSPLADFVVYVDSNGDVHVGRAPS